MNPHDYSDRFLLTIHGIRSDNVPLKKLREHCEGVLPGLKSDSLFYEHIKPFYILSKNIRSLIFHNVRLSLQQISREYGSDCKLFIVAHSFGTLSVIEALKMHINVKIEGLVLLGSIIPRNHYWDGLIRTGQLRHPPLVVVRPLDRTVLLGERAGGGPSGAKGCFARGMHPPFQTYKNGGHTSFYPADCDDIVNVITNGIPSVLLVSYDEWRRNCGFWNRLKNLW